MTRVFINGFGRIGRTILRAWAQGGWPDIEGVGINDIAAPDLCAHLFEYDSVFGPFAGDVELRGADLHLNGHVIPMHQTTDVREIDLTGVDVFLECCGKANTRDFAQRGLEAGAKRVLISGPTDAADVTVVMGANDAALTDQAIVSNASCTTNALAPLVRLLDDTWSVQTGWMTTIHCFTGSQPSIDAPRGDMLRSRAASMSMVPTTTSATQLIHQVLPDLNNQLTSASVRVPVASVSAVDMTATLNTDVTVQSLNETLITADTNIIGHTGQPLVSSDLRSRPESLIVALPETMVTTQRQVRIFGWYDNEWGFSSRMIDMAIRMSARPGL